jgi:DEAD/DEAH box helicase
MVAIYVSVGPVPRGSELVLSSIEDSGRHGVRNLRVIGGQMMLVATYLKTRDISDSGSIPRAIPCFLAKLITLYLALIRPLERHYARICGDLVAIAYYDRLLFVSHSTRLSTRELSSELNKVAQTVNPQQGSAFPFRWGVQIWRQMLKAVLRDVVVPETLRFIPRHVIEQDSFVYHAGFGHHERVGNNHYGVDQGSIVGIGSQHLQAILKHCQRWHVWVGLEDAPLEVPAADNGTGNIPQQLHLINERIEHLHQIAFKTQSTVDSLRHTQRSSYTPGVTSQTVHGPGELLSILPYLKLVTGSPLPKSTEQAVLLQTVIRTQEHVLSILPTGSGKSVAFMVPPQLPGKDITVIILPFRALQGDVLDKMKALRIPHSDGPGAPEGTRAIVLSLEVAFQESTLCWMANDDRVRRIVVDEAHLALIWDNFRQQYFLHARELGKMKKQVVLLTATAPFEQRAQLLDAWGISSARIIAAPHTQRPEVCFMFKAVERFDEDQVVEEMGKVKFAPGEAGIVFVQKREHTTLVASAYQAKTGGEPPYVFMGGEGTHVGNYAEWRKTPRSPWMVSTSALYHGIDHPRVSIAIFASLPNTVSEFQQASGRLARALALGHALVLVPKKLDQAGGPDQHVLWAMAHGTEEHRRVCRRWMLSRVLDQHPLACAYLGSNVQFCDNCELAKVCVCPNVVIVGYPHISVYFSG